MMSWSEYELELVPELNMLSEWPKISSMEMSCNAGACSCGAKLINNVAKNKVDVVYQAKSGISNAIKEADSV